VFDDLVLDEFPARRRRSAGDYVKFSSDESIVIDRRAA
jgi:hypothetical protein